MTTTTISRKNGIIAAAVTLVLLALGILTGCQNKFTEPFKDAPRSGSDSQTSMRVIDNSDGFSNVGQKCDGYGHMVFVVYHGDSAYGSVTVINDPRCGSLTAPLPFGR